MADPGEAGRLAHLLPAGHESDGASGRTYVAVHADDVHALAEQLATACRKSGLNATAVAPTRVRVSAYGTTETIRCMPNGDERLMWWWWGWDEPICPAAHIPDAVRVIGRVIGSGETGP